MNPKHYFNYRMKYGSRAADSRQALDDRLAGERWRADAARNKEKGMGINE